MIIYGLIGYPLSHSWSAAWFSEKFEKEKIADKKYLTFPIKQIGDFPLLIRSHPEIEGLNVTIPYKEKIIDFLDDLDETARKIGAVNTIRFFRKEGGLFLKGYNTDSEGFRLSADLSGFRKALILGTGGATKAVAYVLRQQMIDFLFVSRNPSIPGSIHYSGISEEIIHSYPLIINATPLGMYPDIDSFPPIPYHWLTGDNYLYDLVYNPALTIFLKKGSERGAMIQNGEQMFQIQADKSYEIWNA